MPKAPILSRELFYDRLPRNGGFRLLEWALVNTSVGACVESRSLRQDGSKVTNIDARDMVSFDRIGEIDEDQFFALMGTGGQHMPIDFNT